MSFRPLVVTLAVWLSLSFSLISAAYPEPELLKNIATRMVAGRVKLEATAFFNDQVFMVLNHADGGKKLWVTHQDGSGLTEVSPGEATLLTSAAGGLFFVRSGHLWVTDGTAAGTRQLSFSSGAASDIFSIVPFRSGVVVLTRSGLWLSDGTPEGTRTVSGTMTRIDLWGEVNGTLVFTATDKAGEELWGMSSETSPPARIKDIAAGAASSSPIRIGQVGNTVFFAPTIKQKKSLWKTDGTAKGTVQVHSVAPTSTRFRPDFTVIDGKGCFFGSTQKEGAEAWITDGTTTGTRLLFESIYGVYGSPTGDIASLGKKLFIMPSAPEKSFKVYDLAEQKLTVITPQPDEPALGKYPKVVTPVTIVGGRGFFEIETLGVRTLWQTDGTAAGTTLVPPTAALAPGGQAAYSGKYFAAGDRVFFSSDFLDSTTDPHRIWSTDGTEAGLTLVQGFSGREAGSNAKNYFLATDGTIYFNANAGPSGEQLWRTDGTPEGTRMVKELPQVKKNGTEGFAPEFRLEHNGLIYFTGNPGKLWRTDGTEAGTFCVDETLTGTSTYMPQELAVMNGLVYFKADVKNVGLELACTDGTQAGTRLVKDIWLGIAPSDPQKLFTVRDRLYFTAYTDYNGREIWQSDGTAAGTTLVANLAQTPSSAASTVLHRFASNGYNLFASTSAGLYVLENRSFTRLAEAIEASITVPWGVTQPGQGLYFFGWRMKGPTREYGLFRSTGNDYPDQPQMLSPISESTYRNTAVGTQLYRAGHRVIYLNVGEARIYATDGTAGGTVKIDRRATSILATVGDLIYFNDGANLACMRADGTGYLLLGVFPDDWTRVIHVTEDFLLFGKMDGLWITLGSPETTRRVSFPRSGLYLPGEPPRLIFSAITGDIGSEPYILHLRGYPQLSVSRESGLQTFTNGQTVEMPPLLTGQSHTLNLRLANAGPRPLTNVTVTGPSLPDYTLTVPELSELSSGQIVDLPLTFTPQQGGWIEDTVQVTALADGDQVSLTYHLKGHAVSETSAPFLAASPTPWLVKTGETVTLSAEFIAHPGTLYTWEKDGQPLTTTTTPQLTLPSVALADAGTYTLIAGTAPATSTATISLGVVQPAPPGAAVYAYPGQPFSLTCTAAGPGLSYQWRHRSSKMEDSSLIQGSRTATLTFPSVSQPFDWSPECLVSLEGTSGTVSISSGVTYVVVMPPPYSYAGTGNILNCFVGHEVSEQVKIYATLAGPVPAFNFKAKGLPPGLKISPTGLIYGRPTKALPNLPGTSHPDSYLVEITASNSSGTGYGYLQIFVRPLFPISTYHSLIDRNAALDGGRGLGGTLMLSTTAAGGVSGQMRLGGEVFRFSKITHSTATSGAYAHARVEITVPRNKGRTPLTLELDSDQFFILRDPHQEPPAVTSGILTPPAFSSRHPASGLKGYFTAVISHNHSPQSPQNIPRGSGFLTATVSNSGTATWKGKLADGTTFTGSSPLMGDGSYAFALLHHDLYKVTGSIHGDLGFYAPFAEDHPADLYAQISWMKTAHSDTQGSIEKTGIPLHDLSLVGSAWSKPGRDELFWDLEYIGYNLKINLAGPGLPEEGILQYAGISASHRVTLPLKIAGNIMQKLSISPSTGLFKGSFRLYAQSGPDQPLKAVNIPFEGAFTNDGPACGFFLIPELDEDGWLPKNPSFQSGDIEFIPNTPQ